MNCLNCETPTADGITLCPRCEGDLQTTLTHVHDTIDTAQATIHRQDKLTRNRTSGGDPTTISPVNFAASDRATDLREKLRLWADTVRETEATTDPKGAAQTATIRPDVYLRMSLHIIRQQDYAGDLHDEITTAHRQLVRSIDLPPDWITFGRCGTTLEDGTRCTGELKAQPGADLARCRECRALYFVKSLQKERIATAWGIAAPLKNVVAALRLAGVNVNIATARKWVTRGHLQPKYHNQRGVALYSPAQVCEVLARNEPERKKTP